MALVVERVDVPVEEGPDVPLRQTVVPVPPRVHSTVTPVEVQLSEIRHKLHETEAFEGDDVTNN